MGRPKIDYSKVETPCTECGKKHVLLRKGLCSPCYMKERHTRLYGGDSDYNKKRRENARKWNAENKAQHKENKLKWRLSSSYGLTLEEFRIMEAAQNGVCAICFEKNERGMLLSVDHDHKTGKVRGLLCSSCNLIVGIIETTNPDILERMKQFLILKKSEEI